MADCSQPPTPEIAEWLGNMESNLNCFIEEVKPPQPASIDYRSPSVLETDEFQKLLCRIPRAKELGISAVQMRAVCEGSDIWRSFGGVLAYMIHFAMSHAPKNRRGRRRPGAADLWQVAYVGVAEVFVTEDEWMREVALGVSSILETPRSVVSLADFLALQ